MTASYSRVLSILVLSIIADETRIPGMPRKTSIMASYIHCIKVAE